MENARFEQNAQIFKALSHPIRLRILHLIRERQPCVRAMEEVLGVAQPNVSQHLSLLRNIGIVRAERDGHQVCYRIQNKKVLKILDAMTD
jgi:ArsR family transcriptional regulator